MDDMKKIENEVALANEAKTELAEVPKALPEFEVDKSKSYTEQAKDIVGALATQKAVEDDKLVDTITDIKKEELTESATANLKEEKVKAKDAEKKLNAANYGIFEGVATYAGIKKPLPAKMQKILFTILGGLQTFFLVLIGLPTSIITIIADCIDAIVKKLSSIAKSAKYLVLVLLAGGAVAIIVWIIIAILKHYSII